MKIIPDGVKYGTYSLDRIGFDRVDVVEIADDEWEKIHSAYCQYDCSTIRSPADVKLTFVQYLRELIELKRAK